MFVHFRANAMLCWLVGRSLSRQGPKRSNIEAEFIYTQAVRQDLGSSGLFPGLGSDSAPTDWANAVAPADGTLLGLALFRPAFGTSVTRR